MIPPWAAVVAAVSLAIIALAVIVVAVASVVSVLGVRAFLQAIEHLAGPAIGDVRQLIGTIKAEADSLVGTSRDVRLRIVHAADAAEARLTDLDALVEIVQEEVEETALDAAAALHDVRRGLNLWQWGRKALKRSRKKR